MKRKYIYILAGIVAFVFLIMTLLKTSVHGMNNGRNGFVRKPASLSVIKIGERTFRQPLRDIGGIKGDSVFVVTAYPDKIIITDWGLTHEKEIDLPVSSDNKLRSNFTTRIRFPDLFIFGSNVPGLVHYNLVTGKKISYPIDRAFSRGVMLSSSTAIIRGFDAQFKDEQLRKINLLTGASTEEKGITDKTEGGGFVTDGMLHYDESGHDLLYQFFYSNKFLVIDSNLKLLYTGHLIDTFHNYTARATAIPSAKGIYFTFTSPPKLLSWGSCVDNGRLYVGSRLQADNDTHDRFINSIILDLYDVKTTSYAGSLYLPALHGNRLVKFEVFNNRLFLIYTNQVVIYHIQ